MTTIMMRAVQSLSPEGIARYIMHVDLNDDAVDIGALIISPPNTLRSDAELKAKYNLSDRQVQTLNLLLHGNTTKMISTALGGSEHTARTNIDTLLGKLNASSRPHAIAIAHELIGLPPRELTNKFGLTEREVSMVWLLAQGNHTAIVGHKVGLKESTTKGDIAEISHKVGARNRTHMIGIVYGLIDPPAPPAG